MIRDKDRKGNVSLQKSWYLACTLTILNIMYNFTGYLVLLFINVFSIPFA